MSIKDIVYALIVNIALLAIIANLLSRIQTVQKLIRQEKRGLKGDLILSMIFAGLIILSTCIGVKITSYSLNTRVIGAMSAGLLGGPLVGLYSSAIGAIYVLIFSTPRAFARGSAFATILFGLLGKYRHLLDLSGAFQILKNKYPVKIGNKYNHPDRIHNNHWKCSIYNCIYCYFQ